MGALILLSCFSMICRLINEIWSLLPEFVSGLILSIVSGLIVWIGTERYMREKDARAAFIREQQEYYRQLDCLQIELELTQNLIKKEKVVDSFEAYTRIRRLIHAQPYMPAMKYASNLQLLDVIQDELNDIEHYFFSHKESTLEEASLSRFAASIQRNKLYLTGLKYTKRGSGYEC